MKSAALTLLLVMALAHAVSAEPDEEALGKADGYPVGLKTTMYTDRFKVGSFSATDKILSTREVPPGGDVLPLVAAEDPIKITYRLRGESYTLDDYLDRRRVTALLVMKGDRIIAERYRYGRSAKDRFISFSMAKSVNSLLIGIAVEKGSIASLDDPAEKYVPDLKGSGFGQATIRQLLRMSAGVKFEERYDGRDDIARLRRAQLATSSEKPLDVLASFKEREYPAGEKFGYASAETTVLGYVLARAAKQDLATLTSDWLWKPLGAAEPAAWNIGVDGQEWTEGNFNATLRDWGRLGVLLASDGRRGGQQIVPREYLLDATDAARQPEAFRPGNATEYYGYGYQFWIFPFRTRTFGLLGIYGQAMFIQPATRIVMVQLAVNREAKSLDDNVERDALWRGVLESLQSSEQKAAKAAK